jgi:hypothetical protein
MGSLPYPSFSCNAYLNKKAHTYLFIEYIFSKIHPILIQSETQCLLSGVILSQHLEIRSD